MDFIVDALNKQYIKELSSIPETSLERAEEIYSYYSEYSEKLLSRLWRNFCKTHSQHEKYIENIIHETNSFAGNVLNNLRNYFFYLKEDKLRAQEIRKKLFHNFYMFILLLKSAEIFDNYVPEEF